jgi:hypothetical protein
MTPPSVKIGKMFLLTLAVVPASAPAQTARPAREPVQVVWEHPAPAVRAMAISPEGSVVAVLMGPAAAEIAGNGSREPRFDGGTAGPKRRSAKLRVYSRQGEVLWEGWVDGCSRLVVGPEGTLVGAYTPNSALCRTLYLWDAQGRRVGLWTFTDPIRSVVIGRTEPRVAVGTLSGEVALLRRREGRWARGSWRVSAPVRHLAFGPGETLLVLSGTPIAVGHHTYDGFRIWGERLEVGTPLKAPRDDSVRLSANGNGQFFAIAAETPGATAGEIQLWSARARGGPLWRVALAGRAPSLQMADAGVRLVVAYDRLVPLAPPRASPARSSRPYYERVLACYDEAGVERWWKGGAFFSPLLVALEARGEWALSLSPPARFRLLGRAGETRWRSTSPSPIRIAVASRNGRAVAAYRTDGQLVFLGMSEK